LLDRNKDVLATAVAIPPKNILSAGGGKKTVDGVHADAFANAGIAG